MKLVLIKFIIPCLVVLVLFVIPSLVNAVPSFYPSLLYPSLNSKASLGLPLQTEAQGGADLVAQIELDPPNPDVGQEVTIRVVLRNQGGADATSNFRTYLYVDPPDEPPTPETLDTTFWTLPSLPAGNQSIFERTHTFTVTGCEHVVYVWVDRDDAVSESNENNNLVSEFLCVGVECVDQFEDDDVCSDAGWLAIGETQERILCPIGEQDWVKLTAIGEVPYTIEATNLNSAVPLQLSLYNSCEGEVQLANESQIDWQAPNSGIYYVKVESQEASELLNYELNVVVAGSADDSLEPDDNCSMAREIPTDGSLQTHVFQAENDEDWVKFTINSGETFNLAASNSAAGVTPVISLYDACGNANTFSPQTVNQVGQLQTTVATGQTFYARVVNQAPSTYGAEATYDLSLTTTPCGADSFEDDNSAASANQFAVDSEAHNYTICAANDEDWVEFAAEAGTIYVLQTENLARVADPVLHLYDSDGITELAQNDDYGYTKASRIIWEAPADGTYYAKVRHHDANVSGPETAYDLSISTGVCIPDANEADEADNNPDSAPLLLTDGQLQTHSFCADALSTNVADQDWVSFIAVGGHPYLIQSANLGPESDTLLNLYDRDAKTLLATNDDYGIGRASAISTTLPANGRYYVQIIHYNSRYFGRGTDYQLSISGDIPILPTATPSPTVTPTATATPPPTPEATEVKTLFLVNRQRMNSLFGEVDTTALMSKLYELANLEMVQGAIIQVENDATVAAAYNDWTANTEALLETANANAISSAIRSLLMSFLNDNPNVEYIVIIGSDEVIPFRRVPEGNISKTEDHYAPDVTGNTTQWAALMENMLLTDDYYADKEPTNVGGDELYLPDYGISRLIEQPNEIIAFIDAFMSDQLIEVNNILVTGYDFVQDGADINQTIFNNDELNTDDDLIGFSWTGEDLRAKQLNESLRFDLQSINGHSTHFAAGVPDEDDIQASEIASTASDYKNSLIFSVGCHGGFNDTGELDLAQAFIQKQANYVGNTGYGWGGGGVVYTEALMRNFTRELVRGTSNHIGKALKDAKHNYYDRVQSFSDYDAMILMQLTLYGLPHYEVTSGGTLDDDDPFPSATINSNPPTSFSEVNVGHLNYDLAGTYGEQSTKDGTFLTLDDWVYFSAGEPVQPHVFADVSAPAAGKLHGAVFTGAVYSETETFDPVVALPYNEYVTDSSEPSFSASDWYPAVPFNLGGGDSDVDTVSTLLGQYNGNTGSQRLYDQMSFDTYYSMSPDLEPPTVLHLDGILDQATNIAYLKVESNDENSEVIRVIAAYTDGAGTWQSEDLEFDETMQSWTASITATVETQYFMQLVDGAGNVMIDDNKGRYYSFSLPLPLIGTSHSIYLPLLTK